MIPARIRFAVLERDGFTCQYCGAKAPDATLNVDHVVPRCAGGPDLPDNLITSCRDCNYGKGREGLRFVPSHIMEVAGNAYERGKAIREATEIGQRPEQRIPEERKDAPEEVVARVTSPGHALKLSILSSGLTQAFVAGVLGVGAPYMSFMVSGKRTIPEKFVEPICEITGTNLLAQYLATVESDDQEDKRLAELMRGAA